MRAAGAGDISAWLGPAIGPRAFEVGLEVRQQFELALPGVNLAPAFAARTDGSGKYLADLFLLARLVLARAGVHSVAGGQYCTASDGARFYSYRRDGVTGRQASLIWLN
jgi:copper oxidase (laccase) domain-containing protein